ncbi:malonic semialdehyde reductase [Streptomyces marincola]|uniref:Malonic semialdehyde reductase n=1 Tax=Streptomyces marincola TaxID=2878388 RepID=A0A1W7CV39_9ACTN|nr:malonic semialdehyde reductase [Streptomyces marincola]ARQ68683.1 malonic semialdehyde reductase [Streptomyces marincola]
MSETTAGTDLLPLAPEARDLLFRLARTEDRFADDPVGEDEIRAVHDLVRDGPTAFNQQPLRIHLMRSRGSRRRLAGHLSRGNREKTLTAPLTALLAVDNEFHLRLPELFPHYPGAAAIYARDPVLRERSALVNGALQAAYFLIGIRAAGLAAGPLNGYDEAGLNKDFFPDGRQSVLMVVNVGRPAGPHPRPRAPRLDYEEVYTVH